MWSLLLMQVMISRATEPPPKPDRPTPVPGECLDALEIPAGKTRDCLSVSMPVSDVAWYLQVETDWQKMRDLYRIDLSACEFETQSAEMRAEWSQSQMEAALEPVPFVRRSEFHLLLGAGAGVMIVMASAKALKNVSGGDGTEP